VPDSLLSDTSATLGSENEAWLERLVGRLRGASAGFTTSVLLVSMIELLGSLSSDLITWAETHPVGDPGALEAVLKGWSRSGVYGQLWRMLDIYHKRHENHLRRAEKAGTWCPVRRAPVNVGKRPREPTRLGIAAPPGVPSVAPAVAATRRGETAGTSSVLGRSPRLRTRVLMVVPTGARMDRLVLRARL